EYVAEESVAVESSGPRGRSPRGRGSHGLCESAGGDERGGGAQEPPGGETRGGFSVSAERLAAAGKEEEQLLRPAVRRQGSGHGIPADGQRGQGVRRRKTPVVLRGEIRVPRPGALLQARGCGLYDRDPRELHRAEQLVPGEREDRVGGKIGRVVRVRAACALRAGAAVVCSAARFRRERDRGGPAVLPYRP